MPSQYPSFPDLSRQPALKTKTTSVDPTLRDEQSNGMESSRAKFTRRRRTWATTIEGLTNDDWRTLEQFVTSDAIQYGAGMFYFLDTRDPTHPEELLVRFSKIPEYTDAGWIEGELCQNAAFELKEV